MKLRQQNENPAYGPLYIEICSRSEAQEILDVLTREGVPMTPTVHALITFLTEKVSSGKYKADIVDYLVS